jgi:CRP/FNR family transcriptional regulator
VLFCEIVSGSAEIILSQAQLFRGVSAASRRQLALLASSVRFHKGQRIFAEGDPCPGIYVVGGGAVRIFKVAPNGKEHLLHWAGPGATFAEVAVIGDFDCPANAEAAEETLCVLLPKGLFRQALQRDHALCLELMQGMAEWVRTLVGLMEDIVLRDAAGRVARHLLSLAGADSRPGAELAMLKKDLASHLNLTSETLSRTLRRLAEQGLIASPEGQKIRIEDQNGLAEVAEGKVPRL